MTGLTITIKLPSNCVQVTVFSFSRKLQKHYVFYPESNGDIHHRAVAFENEIEVLERKLFLEEIACDIAEERCNFLGKNLR